jgi:hypothetical protein
MRRQLLVTGVMALALLVVAPGIAHAAPGDFACQATVLRAPSIEISTGFTPTCEERAAGLNTITIGLAGNGSIRVKALHAETGRRIDQFGFAEYVAQAGAAEIHLRDGLGQTVLRVAAVNAEASVGCNGPTDQEVDGRRTEVVSAYVPYVPFLPDLELRDHTHILTPLGLVHLNHIEETEHTDGSVTVIATAFVLEPNSLTPGASIVVGQALAGHTPDSCA